MGAGGPAVQPEAVVERVGLPAARPEFRADQAALGGGERGRVGALRVGGRGHGGVLSGNRSHYFERPARESNGFFGIGRPASLRSARADAERRDGLLESDREPPIKTRHRNGKRGIDGWEARRERTKPPPYPPVHRLSEHHEMTTTERPGGFGRSGGPQRRARRQSRLAVAGRLAGDPSSESLPADGDARPRIDAAIRVFQTGNRSEINGRIEPGDPTWDALAACHLAGIRSGRVRAENWAFVPLRRPGDPSLSEADWRAAFAVCLQRLGERHRTVSSARTFRDGRAADRSDSGRNGRRRSRPARLIRRPVGQNTRGQ